MDIAFLVLRLVVNSSISYKCDRGIRSVSLVVKREKTEA